MAFQLFEKSETLKNLKPELRLRWFNRIDVDSEIPIKNQINSLENEFNEFKHSHIQNEISKEDVESIVGDII
ncbi:hypothetical protein ABGT15_12120 [Flavobacterium enshiense]|uniref:hypothetical protein n=1 Tax=Flavobacterium enshiense TaxID=1341165 RepID=UPI00345DF3E0